MYEIQQSIPAGADTYEDDTYYAAVLYRFESATAASRFVRETPNLLVNDPSWEAVTVLPNAQPFGEDSATLRFSLERGETTNDGFWIYARVGEDLALIQVTGGPTVHLAGAQDLAAAQVACLTAGACPEPVPIPPGLRTL